MKYECQFCEYATDSGQEIQEHRRQTRHSIRLEAARLREEKFGRLEKALTWPSGTAWALLAVCVLATAACVMVER